MIFRIIFLHSVLIGLPEVVNVVCNVITWKPPNTPVSGYVVRYHAVGDVQGVELEVKVPYVILPAYLKGKYLVEVCSNKKKS